MSRPLAREGGCDVNRLERQLCAAVRASLAGEKARPPEAGLTLWNAFQQISATRTYHAAGPNPIQPSEIEAFCRMMRLPFEPRHLRIIMAMDQAWLDRAYAVTKAPVAGVKILPPVSKQPLNAALADLVLG